MAVAVHGCFWHGCPKHARLTNGDTRGWWEDKLRRNRERDLETKRLLEADGWEVVEVWECDDPLRVSDEIEELVRGRRGFSNRGWFGGEELGVFLSCQSETDSEAFAVGLTFDLAQINIAAARPPQRPFLISMLAVNVRVDRGSLIRRC